MKHILLMTATITPPADAQMLARRDPGLRLRDYADALRFYLAVPGAFDAIVFADNSNSDPGELERLATSSANGRPVELMRFWGLDHPAACGRGYGEFKLIDHAMAHSSLIASAGTDCIIWKVTGRYRVLNIARLIDSAPSNCSLYCDLQNIPRPWMDLRVFAFTRDGHERLLRGIHLRIDERETGCSPEIILRRHIGQLVGSERIVPRLRCEPYVAGIRAFDNKSYIHGKNLLIYCFRAGARLLFPSRWI